MINHDEPWSSLVDHSQLWITIVNSCSTWKTMVKHSQPQSTMVNINVTLICCYINGWPWSNSVSLSQPCSPLANLINYHQTHEPSSTMVNKSTPHMSPINYHNHIMKCGWYMPINVIYHFVYDNWCILSSFTNVVVLVRCLFRLLNKMIFLRFMFIERSISIKQTKEEWHP